MKLELTDRQYEIIERVFGEVSKKAIEEKPLKILNTFSHTFIYKLVQMGLLDNIWFKRSQFLKDIDSACFDTGNTFVPIWKVFKQEIDMEHYDWLSNNFYVYRRKEGNELVITSFKTYNTEKQIAYILKEIVGKKTNINIEELDKYIDMFELSNFKLNDAQRQAVKNTLSEKITFLTGSAGSGKTTTLRAIAHVLSYLGKNFQILSPTGKAAKRATDVTGFEAKTIHSFLKISENDEDTKQMHINYALVENTEWLIIDEFSMLSISLLENILMSPAYQNIIFVGDDKQLPSVEPGNFIDMIVKNKKQFNLSHLNKVVRQDSDSGILNVANNVIDDTPELIEWNKLEDTKFIDNCYTPIENIIDAYVKIYEKHGSDSVVILTPVKDGEKGTIKINLRIRDLVNPAKKGKKETFINNITFREGDLIMNTYNTWKNRKEDIVINSKRVFNKETGRWNTYKEDLTSAEKMFIPNGEVGVIKEIIVKNGKTHALVEFFGEEFEFKSTDLKNLIHSYAMTIHKSQGSEYKYVFLIIDEEHKFMLKENIIYTGITRAKQKLFIYGDLDTFNRSSIIKDSKIRKSWFIDMYKDLLDY